MNNPVISEIGEYKIPKAIKPIWKLGMETPKASDSKDELINRDKINNVNPVSRIEEAKLKMICFLL